MRAGDGAVTWGRTPESPASRWITVPRPKSTCTRRQRNSNPWCSSRPRSPGRQRLAESYPIEGYQKTIYRADGLANGPHSLMVKVVNTDGSYVVVDAFDVYP